MTECPKCSFALPNPKAKFCPRCGFVLPEITSASVDLQPIRLEKRGSLMNPFFIISAGLVIAGTLVTTEGNARIGLALLAIGIPLLVISAVLSLSGKI